MKQLFFDLLDYEIPDDVALYAGTTIPDIPDITTPTTVNDAIIAQGKLAANLNTIIKAFVGLAPVELLLRNGGRNPLLKALVASSYELFGELSVERISGLRTTLVRVKTRISGLIGHGLPSAEDKIALVQEAAKLSTQLGSSALTDEQKGALGEVVDGIQAYRDAGLDVIDQVADALADALDRAIEFFL